MARYSDRTIGMWATMAFGLALLVVGRWVVLRRKRKGKDAEDKTCKDDDGDDYHRARFTAPELVWHAGACHCSRVRFRVLAARVLKAVDMPTKIRFPRVTVASDHLDFLSDQAVLSFYSVRAGDIVSVHMFCCHCGMQVFCVPSLESTDVHVNADCVDKALVKDFKVTFVYAAETIPCADGVGRSINRVGESLSTDMYTQVAAPTLVQKTSAFRSSPTQELAFSEPSINGHDVYAGDSQLASLLSLWAHTTEKSHCNTTSEASVVESVTEQRIDGKKETPQLESRSRSTSVTLDGSLHHQLKQFLQRHLPDEVDPENPLQKSSEEPSAGVAVTSQSQPVA